MTQNREKQPTEKAASTDWPEVRQRLKAAALAQGEVSPANRKSILKARAQALARETHQEAADGGSLDILEFLLANERYGIGIAYVRETRPLKDLTPLPGVPPFVLGLINVRGQILSVIDIKRFFDLPQKGLTNLDKVIIVHDGGMELAILADVVLGVRTVPLAELQPSLPTLTGIREEYLKGVTNERTVVLDGGKLLNDKKIIVHEEIGG